MSNTLLKLPNDAGGGYRLLLSAHGIPWGRGEYLKG